MQGQPIHIAAQEYDNGVKRLRFNQNVLRLIESPERLSNAHIAVISVTGAFRKGKSFLLNFFLRYLRALSRGDTRDWIRSKDQLDDGFHWRAGTDRDTTGILIWSEPFFIRKPDGEEVAVLLMDTQGTFDHQSNHQDCTSIFAFSTLVSSVQIFNISQIVHETDLQHLRLFIEFASMAKSSKENVLQHLWFLIRDWQNPDEFDYGVDGGRKYLDSILECDSQMPRENQELRQGIVRHFEQASCCLLPHPGNAVVRKTFQGEVEFLDREFLGHLERFVPHILSPENLVIKKINGRKLTGGELFCFVQSYLDTFCTGKLPTMKSIFTTTVELANQIAANDAAKFFQESTKSFADQSEELPDVEFEDVILTVLEDTMQRFDIRCMERESSETINSREKLVERLQDLSKHLHVLQQLKSQAIASAKKSELLSVEVRRVQDRCIESEQDMIQKENEFCKKLDEIQTQSISKEQMESLIQDELSKHSVALKELVDKKADLESRIKSLDDVNQKLCESNRQAATTHLEAMNKWRNQLEETFEQRLRAHEEREFKLKVYSATASAARPVIDAAIKAAGCSIS